MGLLLISLHYGFCTALVTSFILSTELSLSYKPVFPNCGCSLPQVHEACPCTGPSVGVMPLQRGRGKQGDMGKTERHAGSPRQTLRTAQRMDQEVRGMEGEVENGVTDQCLCLSRIIESEPGETSGTLCR